MALGPLCQNVTITKRRIPGWLGVSAESDEPGIRFEGRDKELQT
jgi:hypothetical protein